MINVTTESVASYQQYYLESTDMDHLVLGVKACHDAHILLTEDLDPDDSSNLWEVITYILYTNYETTHETFMLT